AAQIELAGLQRGEVDSGAVGGDGVDVLGVVVACAALAEGGWSGPAAPVIGTDHGADDRCFFVVQHAGQAKGVGSAIPDVEVWTAGHPVGSEWRTAPFEEDD